MIARSQAIKLKQGAGRGTNQGLGMGAFPPWRTWRFCFSLDAMKRNRLGRTGIVVTDICMGTMTFGLQADEKLASRREPSV
jgi:hypothetical protein